MSRGKIPKTRFLLKAAVILLVLSLSSFSFQSPSLPVMRVEATNSLNDLCVSSDANTAFAEFSQTLVMVPSSAVAEDKLGLGGAAWGNDGKTWTVCSHMRDVIASNDGICFICDRDSVDVDFDMANDCHEIDLSKAGISTNAYYLGFGGAALSNNGKTWSACGHNAPKASSFGSYTRYGVGECYVCDRASVSVPFDWTSSNCHAISVSDGGTSDYFGTFGPFLTNNGLIFSACSKDAGDTFTNKGECIVCSRNSVNVPFDSDDCQLLNNPNAVAQDQFGAGGAVVSNNGLSFYACSYLAGDGGICYVCDREDVGTHFVWATDCYELIPSDISESARFGFGGPALSNDYLTFSACAIWADVPDKTHAGKCYVCDRTSVDNDFVGSNCKLVNAPDSVLQENGYLGYGGPALSNDRLTFSACAYGVETNTGRCIVCERASVTDDFLCYEVNPSDGVDDDQFGKGGPALSNDGSKSLTVCSFKASPSSLSEAGKCYICKCLMWRYKIFICDCCTGI
jgi:hypothetical protein